MQWRRIGGSLLRGLCRHFQVLSPSSYCSRQSTNCDPPVILILFYLFHPHPSPPILLPRLPARIQPILHQLLFFVGAVAAGTYLIYLTNTFSYYAVLKQAPPVGIIWIWSVIELDLTLAMVSLACCGIFLKVGGYSLT